MHALRLLPLLVLAPAAFAGTRYVDANLTTGLNDGTSWADAHQGALGLQTALLAAVSGDEVWVARGIYTPTSGTSRTASFELKNGVALYGGFLGGETSPAERPPFWTAQSFLLGDLNLDDPSGNYGDNSFHVVDSAGTGPSAVLDGFTISGGNANGASPDDRGGGILCQGGAGPTIRDCRFLFNRATFGGAGHVESSSPTFERCSIEGNVAAISGGGFSASASSATWNRCWFSGNSALSGGALLLGAGGVPRVLNGLFRANTATGTGGGGAIWAGDGAQIRNCTIAGNASTSAPAAGVFGGIGSSSVANCIVWDNSGPGGAQGSSNQVGGTAAVTYSIVEGGLAGTGNSGADPQFANPGAGDYALTPGSPAIDAGNNAALPGGFPLDLYGSARFIDEPAVADTGAGGAPIIDIGAQEWPVPNVEPACAGDGSGQPCPCGNDAQFLSGQGCLNSLGTGGLLGSSGVARISADTLVLHGSGMTDATCLYFQGTSTANGGLGAPFGDGLRCAAGTVVRLGIKTNAGGSSQYPSGGDPTISVRGGVGVSGVRTYQVWYRNSAAFCTPDGFNLTSGLVVTWVL